METTRINYLDFLKGLAMIAVILDHTFGLIYSNNFFHMHTAFSVTLFIFVAGITSAVSIEKKKTIDNRYLIKRVNNIIIPYCFATLVYHIYLNNFNFNFELFFKQIITFSACGPFYFVIFFIQLILISPLIYNLINKSNKSIIKQIGIFIAIYIISRYFNYHTQIGTIYGGGGKILGGSYLFVFSLGMGFYLNLNYIERIKKIYILVFSLLILVIFERLKLYLLVWANPPKKYTILYALIVFGIVYSINELFKDKITYEFKIIKIVNRIGKSSLYIFLYHIIAMIIVNKHSLVKVFGNSTYIMTLNKVWILICMFVIPILIEMIIKRFLKPYIIRMYWRNKISGLEMR